MSNEKQKKFRTICVDDDAIEVLFLYDAQWDVWIGEYPFFKEEPRYTRSGRPWKNAAYNECPHHQGGDCNDCGSCLHFKKADVMDLIGVCFNDILRQKEAHTV